MSQAIPHRPRHSRVDGTSFPDGDADTGPLPMIPVQRAAPRHADPSGPLAGRVGPVGPHVGPVGPVGPLAGRVAPRGPAFPAGPRPPAGPYGGVPLRPDTVMYLHPRRRRVLPAILTAVTVVLLAAGVAVGIGGSAGPDVTADPPAPTATP